MAVLFVRILENVRVGGGGAAIRNGVRNGTVAVFLVRTLENVGGGDPEPGVRNPDCGGHDPERGEGGRF